MKKGNNDNQGEARLYCTDQCKYACPTYYQHLYPKGHKTATSREVQPELRQMVLARDNYTCQNCNKYKLQLLIFVFICKTSYYDEDKKHSRWGIYYIALGNLFPKHI